MKLPSTQKQILDVYEDFADVSRSFNKVAIIFHREDTWTQFGLYLRVRRWRGERSLQNLSKIANFLVQQLNHQAPSREEHQ